MLNYIVVTGLCSSSWKLPVTIYATIDMNTEMISRFMTNTIFKCVCGCHMNVCPGVYFQLSLFLLVSNEWIQNKTGQSPICHIWWWSLGGNNARERNQIGVTWVLVVHSVLTPPSASSVSTDSRKLLHCNVPYISMWERAREREREREREALCVYTCNTFQMGQKKNMFGCLPSPSAQHCWLHLVCERVACVAIFLEWNETKGAL